MTPAKQDAPSVLIAGLHKTGTTGIYDTVRTAVSDRDDYAFLYEPKSPEPFVSLGRYAPRKPVVAKLLVHQLKWCAPRYDDFDRRIMMVRDPRDTVISRLLFRPMFGKTSYHIDVRSLDPFVEALKQKEVDPHSYSVKALHDLADKLEIYTSSWDTLLKQMHEQMRLIDEQDFFVLRYEDFVDDQLDQTSAYLGVSLNNKQTADVGWKSHISRSMLHGEWRRWFLDEDVEYFGDMFAGYMKQFGYSGWEREARPKIDPATSSEYIAGKTVNRIIERQNRRHHTWTVDSVQTREELHQIESMAADGRAVWAYRVSLVYDESPLFGPNREQALRWARHGAVLGHAPAMALLANFLREQDNDDREARFWQREHDILKGHQRTTRSGERRQARSADDLAAELKRTQKKLRKVKSSARYRLGSAVSEIFTNPRRGAVSSFVEIGRLARHTIDKKRRARRNG